MAHRTSVPPAPPYDVTRGYVAVRDRAIHYRVTGTGPAVVMLHDSPRSSRLHIATMRALSHRFRVYALDTPGYGNSDPLPETSPAIGGFADALGEVLCALGLDQAPIYATHTSAKIALEYAARRGDAAQPSHQTQSSRVILDGLSIPAQRADEAFIAAYMRPFVLDDAGGYLAAEWTRMRDMLRWFPWFEQTPETRMPIAQPSEAWISDYMIDFLSAGPSYSSAYGAAMRYDPMPALRRVSSPVLVAARADDVLYESLDRVPLGENPALTVERLPADPGAWLAWLEATFAAAVEAAPPAPSLPSQPETGAFYADLPHGQMRVHRGGRPGGRPLLILSAPTTLHALAWQAALPARTTLVPELPGFGESDPLPTPSLDDAADALAIMLGGAGYDHVDVLGMDLATPLACLLAGRHPALVHSVIIDGACDPGVLYNHDVADRIAPAFPFDPAGGHLHRTWHMLRDGEANWPWYDGSAEARRALSPILSAKPLHEALIGVLKQPKHYGDIARAVCSAGDEARYSSFSQRALILHHPDDPGYGGTEVLAAKLPNSRVVQRPADLTGAARIVETFLAEDAPIRETVA